MNHIDKKVSVKGEHKTHIRNFLKNMKFHTNGIIEFLLVIIIALTLRCGNRTVKTIHVPEDFEISGDIFLGGNIDILKKEGKLKYFDSCSCYFLELEGNPYFQTIFFNVGDLGLLWKSDIVKSMEFGATFTVAEKPNGTDKEAKDIIDICSIAFGSDYEIVDTKSRRNEPMLIWDTDSCFVTFVYMPYNHYLELLEKVKINNFGYVLQIKYELEDFEKEYKESIIWSRESLGLE